MKFVPVRDLYQRLYGHRPAIATVTQMKKKGLKTALIGGKTCCTEEALRAYVEEGVRLPKPSTDKPRSEASTAKALEQVDQELSELGI